MDLGINDKVAFIGGSSQGIGKSIAMELSKEGVQPIITGRNLNSLTDTQNEIHKETGITPYIIRGDLSIEKDRIRIVNSALNEYNKVDIVITNSGGPPAGKFDDFDSENWRNAYELLLGNPTSIIRGFLPGMKEQNWGRIITITSMAVKQPVKNLILSNSVRVSVVGLVKSLSNEVAQYNITVNNVMPGYTDTERLQELIEANPSFNMAKNEIPMGRFADPCEIGYAVAFLSSQKASYITGISLAVDGGWTKSL